MEAEATGRAWEGRLRPAWLRWLPIAREGLRLLARKKLFWPLYLLCLLNFTFNFAVIYLAAHVASQQEMIARFAKPFLDRYLGGGEGGPYFRFIVSQAFMVMMILAFAGAGIIGDDRRQGALLFYLSKPIKRLDYVIAKLAIVFAVGSLITTAPALVLFLEYGLFSPTWDYLLENAGLIGSIAAYGSIVSLALGFLMLALSSLLRRTAPIIAAWAAIFSFSPALRFFVEQGAPRGIRHLDLWWNLRTIGGWIFAVRPERGSAGIAAAVVIGVACLSAAILARTVRAVEVSR
ncbi:MAG: ABC transporter permease subunit [Planctomycetes bacterium]|nr:ABC transporter permease subunit [Planctomycetota bacterium]